MRSSVLHDAWCIKQFLLLLPLVSVSTFFFSFLKSHLPSVLFGEQMQTLATKITGVTSVIIFLSTFCVHSNLSFIKKNTVTLQAQYDYTS